MSRTSPQAPSQDTETQSAIAADLLDERLIRQEGFRGRWRAATSRIRSGDLGSLPVVVGLAVIWIIFQSLNDNFLSPGNLTNMTQEAAAVGVISVGIVLILLLGEIDLSVGSVSGVAGAVLAVLFVSKHMPLPLAIVAALALGGAIGLFYSILFTRFGVPSFVITLGGLLGFAGLQLQILGNAGTINIPFDSWLVRFCQQMYLSDITAYTIVAVVVAAYIVGAMWNSRRRQSAGLSAKPTAEIIVRAVVMAAALGFSVWYLNQERGVGWLFVLFVVIVVGMNLALTRTRWGRAVFAVGGNVEAARRAGIRVTRVYVSVFMLTATLAALGGILSAGFLASVNQSSGANDTNLNAIAAAVIGGTSLFGGRGGAYSAFLGILVIESISSGLNLLNLASPIRFMITGAVLLIAVIIDSMSRRSRQSAGRA